MDKKMQAELLKSAGMRMKEGDLSNALSIYDKIIEEDDKCAEAYFNIANIFHIKGNIGKAMKSFHKVLELDPYNADASISLSVLLNDIGRYEEAKIIFDKANRHVKRESKGVVEPNLNKKFSLKHYELAEMYYSYSRYDEALFEYNKAVGLDPSDLNIKIKVAKVYLKKGFTTKAFEELKRLKTENPSFIPAKMALGLLHFESGNVLEARTQWQNILSIEPGHQEAAMYLKLSDSATETVL